jgi:hypothetical protein
MSGAPDPKPMKPYRATKAEWETLRSQLDWFCVACGESWEPALGAAHIIGRDEGGDDVIENLVVLCGYKEARPNGCHVVLQEHRDGWQKVAYHVRAYVLARASRYGYALRKVGLDGFEKRFPTPPQLAIGDLARYSQPDGFLRDEDAA